MEEALEQHGGLLVPEAESSEVLEPRDRAFDGPAAFVPAQGSAVLRGVLGRAALAVRPDHLDALLREVVVEQVAVVGLVADDPIGVAGRGHEVEESLDEPRPVRARAGGGDRHGQAADRGGELLPRRGSVELLEDGRGPRPLRSTITASTKPKDSFFPTAMTASRPAPGGPHSGRSTHPSRLRD